MFSRHYLTTPINDITNVTNSALWNIMLKENKAIFSEENFINYFVQYGIDSAIIAFLNAVVGDINFTRTADNFGAAAAVQLFDAVAVCNQIDTPKYQKALNDLGCPFENYEAVDITEDKFHVLICDSILPMDLDALAYVREYYTSHIGDFVLHNLYKYLDLQTAENFNLNEALIVLTADCADNKKIKLMALTAEPISIIGKEYSDNVCAYIIKNNHEPSDDVRLFVNYSSFEIATRVAVKTLALSEVSTIIDNTMSLDDALLSELLCSVDVPREYKIQLFTIAIPRLNEDTCNNHFEELCLADLSNIFAKVGGRRKYDNTTEITTIFAALKLNGWIYDYQNDEHNPEKCFVLKTKPKEKAPEFLD